MPKGPKNRANGKGRTALIYINPHAPRVNAPRYPGHYYETLVPATLDLAERARLAVNALTAPTDPDYDYELYWIVDLLASEPAMYHTVDDHVQDKFFLALPQCRTACGSKQNLDIEHSLMQTYLRKQGLDGLIYIPIKGRLWAIPPNPNAFAGLDELPADENHWSSVVMVGRVLGAFAVYAFKDPSGPWHEAARRLADALKKICVVEGDIAYLCRNWWEPKMKYLKPANKPIGFRAAIAGWIAQGLAEYYHLLGDGEAIELAAKLMRYVMRDSGYFDDKGRFTEEFPDSEIIHFHAHSCQILATLQVVQETGDRKLLKLASKAYAYAVRQGETSIGFFPEMLNFKGGAYGEGPNSSEICSVADMIMSGLKLSLSGVDRWDDVDRWVRNQFAECQLTGTHWLTDGHMEKIDRRRIPLAGAGCDAPNYGSKDKVIERVVGGFSGWPSANDFVQGRGWSIMHCCTGNATRALYHVWQNILTHKDGALTVNLLMNRASQWADVDSHIPYQGRVDVRIKQAQELEIRLPEWVESRQARCTVNGRTRKLGFSDRYAKVGKVCKDDEVILKFPIHEITERVIIEKSVYTITKRGNEVVHIDPPGVRCPLYQRAHYRSGQTLWRKVTRFVPDQEISWS